MTLVVYAVALFLLHGGVDNGNQPHTALFHLGGERLEVGKTLGVNGKILEAVHVVDVEIEHVERDTRVAVAVGAFLDIFFGDVSPAALSVAERPLRRDIALADQRAEFADDGFQTVGGDDVQVEREFLGRDRDSITVGVADVKGDLAGDIEESAEAFLAVDDQEVVRAVDGALLFGMERLVGAEALIDPAALVDAAHGLAQSVDAGLVVHLQDKAVVFQRKRRGHAVGIGQVPDDRSRADNGGKVKSFDHGDTSYLIFLMNRV